MSELIVSPVTISAIKPHPNADRLEICRVGGWDIISGKGNYAAGDVVVHVPPDAMVPRKWADEWGVTQYLSFKQGSDMGRVRAARLRGVPSFGFLVPNESGAELGTDLQSHYGIEKYEPPPPPVGMSAGQMRNEHPLFYRYTDIQNLRNYQDKLAYGEVLIATEKIHGTNSRVGWIRRNTSEHQPSCVRSQAWDIPEAPCSCEEHELVIGTHRTQRDPADCGVYGLPLSLYPEAFQRIYDFFLQLKPDFNSLIVFGEIFGPGVQDLHYGKEKAYRVFDICLDGEYIGGQDVIKICQEMGIPHVPVLARGILDFEQLEELASGNTTLNGNHIREGIVVRPMMERTWSQGSLDPNPKRMIFKLVSPDYLCRKDGTEYH